MSGRGPPEAAKPGRSQNSQNRLPGGFGAGRGAGGRGQSSQALPGRGNGLPTANQPTYISEEYGMSYPGNMGGGGYHGSDNKAQQQQRSGPVPGRGVILPRGVPAYPQASNIPFGTIIGEDGTINEFPSPQQDRTDPNKGAGRTANAGRGPPRQNGPRNLNKPIVQKGPHSMLAGGGGSPLAFGSNVPSMAMMNSYAAMGQGYPGYGYMGPVNSSAFQAAGYQGYPQTAMYGQQMQYQQFAPHQQQAYQPPQQYGRGTQHQAYHPPPQQMRQPQQADPKASVPKVPAPPVERKSKALSIMDPKTHQPVTLGDRPLAAAASSSQAGVRKQPSQGAPTPRPGQASSSQNGPMVPQSRQLHITAPPQGGPSKASAQAQPKPATTPASVVTTLTPQAASMAKPPAAKPAPVEKAQPADANGDLKASGSTPSQGTPAESAKLDAEPSKEQAIEQEAAAAKQRAAEEAAARHKAAEEEAAAKEQAAKEAATKQKAADEAAAAEAAAVAEAAAAAEAARKAEEEASAKRKAEEEAAAAAAAKKKADEEATAAAAAAKEAEEEAALKRKAEEDEAAALAQRRAEEEEAAQRKAAEDAERRETEEAAARQVAEKSAAEQAEREAEEAAVQSASLQVAAAKDTAEEAAPTADNVPAAASEEHEPSTSSSDLPALEDTASSASAPAQPKKKGKKALNAAIERRKDKESYDGREVDMSAYKPVTQQAANAPAASPAPIATPEPKQDAVKAGSEASEEDWEDKKIETPRGSAEKENHVVSTRKVYSRDFLEAKNRAVLATSVHDWPGLQHFDPATAFLLRGNDLDAGRRGHASMRGPPPHLGGRGGDDRWQRGKPLPAGPGFQPPGMAGPPPPPGRGGNGGRGGPPGGRGGIEGDRWARGTALPPIPSGGRTMTLHRASNRYERGKLISENPEEEKKQKELKSLLNKITPEKYAVIRDKILAVGVNTVLSLKGLIDQVFDKALTEPTFCEIYATLCNDLNQALPEFDPEPDAEDQKKITFRRVLLNKCQEEFEEGAAAILAVKAREKADADKASGPQEEVEEGEISKEDKDTKRRADFLEAEAEQKARRRALGNIQFIGQLYKARMLTEKIMHSCIQTLLEEVANPRREDIECLCKLMSTIGGQLDASPKATTYMTAYFQRMEAIQQIASLEVRHKFMIQDVLELRMNRWQERRKVEGPKTLDEIHRDARAEQMAPRSRGPPNRGGFREAPPPMRQPMPMRSRHEDRLEDKPRPMQRTPSQEGIFAPGGRGGGGFRPGGSLASRGSRDPSPISSAPPPPAAPSRPEPEQSRMRPQPAGAPAAAPAPAGAPQLSAEETKKKGAGLLREFMQLRSTKEVAEIITSELVPGQADIALIVEAWFTVAFEERGIDLGALKELISFTSSEPSVPHKAFQDGITAVLNQVHDVDYPAALKLMGDVIGSLLASGVLQLEAVGNTILKAGSDDAEEGEDPLLIDSGKAAPIMAASLQQFAATAGLETAVAAWRSSRLQLDAFLPSYEREEKAAVSALVNKFEIQAFA